MRWRGDLDLAGVEIQYVHRGAPDHRRWARGSDILDVGPSFVTLPVDGEASSVPLHRVDRITYDGELVWERRGEDA